MVCIMGIAIMNDSTTQYLQGMLGGQPSEGTHGNMVMKSEDEHDYTNGSFMPGENFYPFPQSSPTDFQNLQSPPNFVGQNIFNTVSTSPNNPIGANTIMAHQMQNQRRGYPMRPMMFQTGMLTNHLEQLPDTTQFPGEFKFELSLGPHTETATKSADYTFSQSLNKLYVQKGAQCPFKLKTSHPPPNSSMIKILPVYKGSHVLSEAVKRCSNHAESEAESDPNHKFHFIRAANRQTRYDTSESGRSYLTIPYTGPQAGAEFQTELLSFMCFNSCGHSSHSKRRIDVIFILENEGQVLGRQVIEVRVCACPGRDRTNEENTSKGGSVKRPGTTTVSAPRGKRRKYSSNTDEEFVIKTNSHFVYQILSKMKDMLQPHFSNEYETNQPGQGSSSYSPQASPGNVFKTDLLSIPNVNPHVRDDLSSS